MDQHKIEKRIRQLDAQKQSLKARLRTRQRQQDTRRKILLGALILDRIDQNDPRDEHIIRWVKEQLPGFLSRTADRALFEDIFNDDEDGGDGAQKSDGEQDSAKAP